jgi:hypothetical protein
MTTGCNAVANYDAHGNWTQIAVAGHLPANMSLWHLDASTTGHVTAGDYIINNAVIEEHSGNHYMVYSAPRDRNIPGISQIHILSLEESTRLPGVTYEIHGSADVTLSDENSGEPRPDVKITITF